MRIKERAKSCCNHLRSLISGSTWIHGNSFSNASILGVIVLVAVILIMCKASPGFASSVSSNVSFYRSIFEGDLHKIEGAPSLNSKNDLVVHPRNLGDKSEELDTIGEERVPLPTIIVNFHENPKLSFDSLEKVSIDGQTIELDNFANVSPLSIRDFCDPLRGVDSVVVVSTKGLTRPQFYLIRNRFLASGVHLNRYFVVSPDTDSGDLICVGAPIHTKGILTTTSRTNFLVTFAVRLDCKDFSLLFNDVEIQVNVREPTYSNLSIHGAEIPPAIERLDLNDLPQLETVYLESKSGEKRSGYMSSLEIHGKKSFNGPEALMRELRI